MAATSVLISVTMLVISFIIGVFVYFITDYHVIKDKKKNIEDVFSFFVNFIIFIWVGKIIWNLELFISDPLAVLAYPSFSGAFYIAFILSSILVVWKLKKGVITFEPFVHTLITVFIFSSFIYEFIELVWQDNLYTWRYLALLFALSMLYLIFSNRISYNLMSGLVILLWGLGQAILSITLPFTTVFGYLLDTWFFIVMSLVGMIILILEIRRKKVS